MTHSEFLIPGWNNFNFQQLNPGIQQQIEECLRLHFCNLSMCCVSQVQVGWTVLQLGGFWTIPAQQSPQNNSESGLIRDCVLIYLLGTEVEFGEEEMGQEKGVAHM